MNIYIYILCTNVPIPQDIYVHNFTQVGGGGHPLHRYTHNGHLIHVDQNMTQFLIKLGIFGGSLAPCLLYYREMKTMCAWND